MTGQSRTVRTEAWRAWFTRAVLASCFLAMAAGFAWYYRHQEHWYYRSLEERANMMLDVQEAAIAAHLRNNRYNLEQIDPVFERLAKAPLVNELAVTHEGHTLLRAEGAPPEGETAVYTRTAAITSGPHLGYGRMAGRGPSPSAGWLSFPEDPVSLSVRMDCARLEVSVAGARLRFFLSLAATGGGFALALLVTESRRRQRSLEMDLVVARERVSHHQQLAQLGAGLAHETKNPLGLVRGMAQSIADGDVADPVREQAVLIIDEVDRTVRHVNGFLDLAREKDPVMKPVALEELFAGLEALVRQEAAQERVEVAWAPEGLTVRADGALLRRALLNLVINALKACAPGGRVTVSAQRGARGVYIAVEDDGVGIAPEDLEKVSSPYFSRFESGTGLGLSIVDQVARAHGWRLEIASEPGRGTRVTLGPADPGS